MKTRGIGGGDEREKTEKTLGVDDIMFPTIPRWAVQLHSGKVQAPKTCFELVLIW